MTDYEGEDYDIDYMDIEELEGLPYHQVIARGTEQFNTGDMTEATDILQNAADDLARVQFYIHDADSGEMLPLFTNEGHSPGMRADYLLDIMHGDNATLDEELKAYAYQSGVTVNDIDWYQINVFHLGQG